MPLGATVDLFVMTVLIWGERSLAREPLSVSSHKSTSGKNVSGIHNQGVLLTSTPTATKCILGSDGDQLN